MLYVAKCTRAVMTSVLFLDYGLLLELHALTLAAHSYGSCEDLWWEFSYTSYKHLPKVTYPILGNSATLHV